MTILSFHSKVFISYDKAYACLPVRSVYKSKPEIDSEYSVPFLPPHICTSCCPNTPLCHFLNGWVSRSRLSGMHNSFHRVLEKEIHVFWRKFCFRIDHAWRVIFDFYIKSFKLCCVADEYWTIRWFQINAGVCRFTKIQYNTPPHCLWNLSQHLNTQSRGFEISRDLMTRHLVLKQASVARSTPPFVYMRLVSIWITALWWVLCGIWHGEWRSLPTVATERDGGHYMYV